MLIYFLSSLKPYEKKYKNCGGNCGGGEKFLFLGGTDFLNFS